jgi:hypothetical protein
MPPPIRNSHFEIRNSKLFSVLCRLSSVVFPRLARLARLARPPVSPHTPCSSARFRALAKPGRALSIVF